MARLRVASVIAAAVAIAAIATACTPAPPPANIFGVAASGGVRPDIPTDAHDLGAGWVRVNESLGVESADKVITLLERGLSVVVTVNNRDPKNVDTAHGSLSAWPQAGFPFLDRAAYERDLEDLLQPLVSHLTARRQVWVQDENEVSDVTVASSSIYWRGNIDQYLDMTHAFSEAVKHVSPAMRAVLSSFTSQSLDKVIDPSAPLHGYQVQRITTMLNTGSYDVVDLHFYGCASAIPAKARWVKEHLAVGKLWISTENSGPNPDCAGYVSWRTDLTRFEQLEAQEVPIRMAACADNGGAVCLWFSQFDLTGEVDAFNHLGLLDRSAPPRQKPAYGAFKTFVASRNR